MSRTGPGPIYVSIGLRRRGSDLYDWGAWTQLEGQDGRSISSVTRSANGTVTITYDDGATDTFVVVDGADGTSITASFTTNSDGDVAVTFSDGTSFTISAGQAGRGITSITRNSATGVVTIAYDDGSASAHFTIQDGADGDDGNDGTDGADGVGISSVDRSNSGLVTTYLHGWKHR